MQEYITRDTFMLNLETGNRTRITSADDVITRFAISPNRQALAYILHNANNSDVKLVISDSMNKNKKVVLESKHDFGLYGWLNDQQVQLAKDGKVVIFNPFTRQETDYSIEAFPSFDTNNPRDDMADFDPTATRAIYKNGYIFLLDLTSKQIIAQVMDGFERSPISAWTLDGSEAAIIGTTVVGKNGHDIGDDIFGVSQDGQVTQLTYLSEHYGAWLNIHSLSWSPDSRYIAFWMRLPGTSVWQLAVLDTSTKKVTDYCISTDPYAGNIPLFQGQSAPIWSPDGKQMIVEQRSEETRYGVLVDITENIAFRITVNMYPAGWMLAGK